MQNRILYYAGLGSLLLVWVVGQTPDAPVPPAQPAATSPVPVPPPVPAAETQTPPKPTPNAAASPAANGISPDGKLPTIPAGQTNIAVNAPNANDICEFAFNFPKLTEEAMGEIHRHFTGLRVTMIYAG